MKILFWGLVFINALYASEECGEYKISGIVRMINNSPVIIVNEHSLSEQNFRVPILEEPKIVPYIDSFFELSASLDKKMDGTKGKLSNLNVIGRKLHSPLHHSTDKQQTGLQLIKPQACKN
jgi:hypothetical protein